MPPICFICNDNSIEYNCRCYTCKKSVCKSCYSKVITRTDKTDIEYKCPFCKCHNKKDILDLDKEIIIQFMDDKFFKLKNKYQLLKEENENLKEQTDEEMRFLQGQIYRLERIIENLETKNENENEKGKRKPTEYNLFFKKKSKELKIKYPNMSPQDIMKEISKLWKQEKEKMTS